MRGPAEAAKKVSDLIPVEMRPRKVIDLITELIDKEGWANGEDTAELAEAWESKVKSRLRQILRVAEENAQNPRFTFSLINDDFVQGSCFVELGDDDNVRDAKLKRAKQFHYIDSLQRIDPLDFERLSGRVLSLFNVEEEFVTRASADQGIDFFGLVPFGEILKPSAITPGAESQLKVWLVGQAKHYRSTQVSTKDIRELVGSVSLAKSKVYAGAKDPLSDLQMRTCDPVFFLFFTTGNISKDARNLLKKAGVVAMDGSQLAIFLADHGVGIVNGEFLSEEFDRWLVQS